ncbi:MULTISPECIES: DNA gyrase/topoisomerase IV subunit B [unclassified Streptomyces]|uniref:DNA gyrase/topoisomerase IV subunit B n=1 Tax=unclassified Streptomyces TaxID=2593676 RepID=UPI002DDC27E0|nr:MULTISPECIES: DNA topoisomerase IV subunit B [unclassified Streptomyces]WSF84019.1 type IIA DNA topoisomerase subunit B [Streptomyces sp. NBC_01744]WSC39696.1 type IIA DNA topoisomerase subunit B [Streptomyces sp. NBC_01763]WSC47835.1 type IIA DNA topoisomerase subunit B [Streptomyces sp. NBC_01762]WSC53176.1 type IIA DNA topoisomerase subunit B [Streptomyces sp. NBC_01761]WSD27487.1 type IIA DNA topoisomerase subunit B [Streptomyces sp. NBC_01751]
MTADTSVPSTALLTGADQDSSNYTARHLLVLEGLEAVRKRPGMYIGSTDSRGLMHCLWEIIDNSVDEALGGYCDHIEVILHDDNSVEVRDNGRGIPVDVEPKTGLSGIEVVMTKLHAGGKFGGGSYAASGGLHGVGASVVNALSARLDVEVDRNSATHSISFRRGVPGIFTEQGPESPFDPASGLRKGKRVPKTRTGTRVRYWADRQIFLKDAKLNLETLHQRARQTAFLVPGLTIVVRDERGLDGEGKTEETFRFDGGISEFCEYLAQDKAVCDVLRLTGQGTFKETVPVLDERGHMTATEVTRELVVDIAMRWGTGYDTNLKSFVNIIATPKGGTHVTGFERSVTKTVNEVLRSAKVLRVAEDDIVKDDALEGLTAVVTVRLAEPQFEGQTKEVLGTSAANRIVANVVAKELKAFLTSTKRDAKAQARAVLDKAVAAARTRIAARQHKDAQRRKTALESSSLPAKLADCRSDDVERSELFIVEGDSALGTAKLARNSEFQALLPIRGKILNVQKASVTDMLKNAECGAIIQVIGAGSGRTFDIDAARYGKIILLVDADVDGAHIRILLLTLFQRYMRPMVEAGRVFAAVPPLHRIELSQPKKGQDKYIYTYSDRELRDTLLELQRKNVRYKDSIQRYKGLGEMDADQLAETTMDPRHRTLRRINIGDLESSEQVFDLLMGNEVAPRKEFISSSAATLDRSRIDA